jgi:site-specific recombinase XerD
MHQWKDLWLGLKKACRKAEIPDVTWHTFRHTFASRPTAGGADLVTVKRSIRRKNRHSDTVCKLWENQGVRIR